MAEGLARHQLAEVRPEVRIHSAGLRALVNASPAAEALVLMHKQGMDISRHRARQLTADLIAEAELILVMEEWQISEVMRFGPFAKGKVFLLGQWSELEVDDPFRQGESVFEETFSTIREAWDGWYDKLWGARKNG